LRNVWKSSTLLLWLRSPSISSVNWIHFSFIVGAFEDDDITHVEGSVDPIRDIEIIHEELQLKDEEMIGPILDKLEKVAVRGGDKKLKPEYVSKHL
jgi:ribosome-binding ATPase YchF (GTP1/OBG family)